MTKDSRPPSPCHQCTADYYCDAPRFSEGRPIGRVWQWIGRGELEGLLYFEHVNNHLKGSQVKNKDNDKDKDKDRLCFEHINTDLRGSPVLILKREL